MKSLAKVGIPVFLVLVLLAAIVGCAAPAQPSPTIAPTKAAEPTKAPEATKPPATTPAAEAKPAQVIELKYNHHSPPESFEAKEGHAKWAQLVEQRTNGKVKVTVYPGETLSKAKDALDVTIAGTADISWAYIGLHLGRFPLTEVIELPMLGIQSSLHGSKVVEELYETTPEVQKEWSQVKVLFLHTLAPQIVATAKKKVQVVEDLKGQRIRAVAGNPTKFLQTLGATPVNVAIPEIYEALQRGTIDGYSGGWPAVRAFKLHEVLKYAVDYPLYIPVYFLVMNQKKWDSLPPDVQKAISDVSGQYGAQMFGKVFDDTANAGMQEAASKGMEIVKLSADELKRWQAPAAPIWDEWVSNANSKGANGKALLDKVKQLVEKNK